MRSFSRAIGRPLQAAVLAAAVLAATSAFAQAPSAAAMASARQLVTVTGATALFSPLVAGVVEQAKILYLQQNPALGKDLNEIAAQMRKDLQPRFKDVEEEVAKLYAEHFNEQELKEILAFYQSPVGKKVLQEQPKVVEGSMKYAQDWANKLSEEVTSKMRDELKKRGHPM
jgi:hypothetical protein